MREFDQHYLEALAKCDRQTENDFVSRFTLPLKAKLRTHLRSPQAVEDGYQETLLRVFAYFRSGKSLRAPDRLPGFVLAICSNVVLEMVRARRRDNPLSEELSDAIDSRSDPETVVLATESRQTVRRVLSELSQKDQELLQRICLEEEPRGQVCREFQVSREYLRLLLYRARVRFKVVLRQRSGPERSRISQMAASQLCPVRVQYAGDGPSADSLYTRGGAVCLTRADSP